MKPEQAKKLREPFPAGQIQTIPRAGVRLSYVSHASVTDRLLEVDPEWTWGPLVDEKGLPLIDRDGPFADPSSKLGLWITVTIAGVAKTGYGDGKNVKEAISDALRNAAMRYGVALDLWAKEDLHPVTNGATPETPAAPAKPAQKPTKAQFEKLEELVVKLVLADPNHDWPGVAEKYASREFGHGIDGLARDEMEKLIVQFDKHLAELEQTTAVT